MAFAHTIPRETRTGEVYRFEPGRFAAMHTPTLLLEGEVSPPFLKDSVAAVQARPAPQPVSGRRQARGHGAFLFAPELFTIRSPELPAGGGGLSRLANGLADRPLLTRVRRSAAATLVLLVPECAGGAPPANQAADAKPAPTHPSAALQNSGMLQPSMTNPSNRRGGACIHAAAAVSWRTLERSAVRMAVVAMRPALVRW